MKPLFFCFVLGIAFTGSYFATRYFKTYAESKTEKKAPAFLPAPFVLKNRSFVVVILGFNNGANVAKTLHSVFSQNYEQFRVIYIDDASDDGSYDFVRDLVDGHSGIHLIHNATRIGPLTSLIQAVKNCSDEEIVVVLQGEDWLAHEWVLERLNAYYADPDLWMAYGQYCDFPTYAVGECSPSKEKQFRQQPFKTFYAALFKKIRESDLSACTDLSLMIPMLEMAKDHFHFIPEVLYIRNLSFGFR